MFGPIGGFELLVLAVIGLLIFGPRRLPEIGRSLGRMMMEFRKAANELKTSIEREIDLEEMKDTGRGIRREIEKTFTIDPEAESKKEGGDRKDPGKDDAVPRG